MYNLYKYAARTKAVNIFDYGARGTPAVLQLILRPLVGPAIRRGHL
jgi:hypothetical protein